MVGECARFCVWACLGTGAATDVRCDVCKCPADVLMR